MLLKRQAPGPVARGLFDPGVTNYRLVLLEKLC